MRFYYPLEHLHVLPLKHYRQWGLYRINPQRHCSLKTRRKTHWSVSTGEKTGPSPTDRHWPGHGALVWNLPGFVSYQKKWLLQRKRRQLDIFMHAEINPCLQCLMKLCRLKDKSLLLFLLLLSFVFLLALSFCLVREKYGQLWWFPSSSLVGGDWTPPFFPGHSHELRLQYFCSSSTCSKPTVVAGRYGSF